jgi:putative phosphoesterase
MRIGLIADTHIPLAATHLPPEVFKVFQGVDLILHGGDIYRLSVLDDLEQVAPVLAALGDDDPTEFLADDRVEMKHVLDLEGLRIWLIHERPWMYRMPAYQEGHSPDVIVHGHTHDPEIRKHGGVLFVGSVSPTFYLYRRGPGTVALLDIGPDEASASIVKLGQNPCVSRG